MKQRINIYLKICVFHLFSPSTTIRVLEDSVKSKLRHQNFISRICNWKCWWRKEAISFRPIYIYVFKRCVVKDMVPWWQNTSVSFIVSNWAWTEPSHNFNQYWFIFIGDNLQQNLYQNTNIFFRGNAFEHVVCRDQLPLFKSQYVSTFRWVPARKM